MRHVLLDTHAWVWSMTADPRLSSGATATIEQAETVSISAISLFEIGQKVRLGKWPEMEPFLNRLIGLAEEQGGATVRTVPGNQFACRHAGMGAPRSVRPDHWRHGDHEGTDVDLGRRGLRRACWRSEVAGSGVVISSG